MSKTITIGERDAEFKEYEKKMGKWFGDKMNVVAQFTHWLCPWDYEFFRDEKLVGIGEYKRRFISVNRYSTYRISAKKMFNIEAECRRVGVVAVLIIEWNDAVRYWNIRDVDSYQTSKHGSASCSTEDMLVINISEFQEIPDEPICNE